MGFAPYATSGKRALAFFESELRRWLEYRAHKIHPSQAPRGTVAMAYISWPFREGWNSHRARGHTNAFEVVAMAECWAEAGFEVVVGDFRDPRFLPPKQTRVVLDLHGNLHRWANSLPQNSLKIHHATGCHWLEQNMAELARLNALKERRGKSLLPRRQVSPCFNAEVADLITYVGNDSTAKTYKYAGKPMRRIRLSSAFELEWPRNRNFEEARRRFLWMGSFGMVHKGLDLVLEAFAKLPHLQLTICGRPHKETDFFEHYQKEFQLPNVRLAGWVSPDSAEFAKIAQSHAAIVYPSCSEGGGGAVIHAMHAGLLPICTREASVDLENFGQMVAGSSVDAVRAAVETAAAMSAGEVEWRARTAWEFVRNSHSRENFRREYAAFVQELARKQ